MNESIQIISVVILCSAPVVGLLIFFIIDEVEFNEHTRQFKKSMEQLNRSLEEPFSISDYYDRMMKVSEDLARQKAERKYEPTVLWLLLDGLRINEDGTLEWVRKEKPKKDICIPSTPPESILFANNVPYFTTGVEMCSVQDRLRLQYSQLQSSMAAQMAELQNQMQTEWLINQYHNLAYGPATKKERSFDAYGRTFDGEPFYSWAQEL